MRNTETQRSLLPRGPRFRPETRRRALPPTPPARPSCPFPCQNDAPRLSVGDVVGVGRVWKKSVGCEG
eukprot:5887015-Prorocentrum_lima.AAC.1